MKNTSYQHHMWRYCLCMRPRALFLLHSIHSHELFTLDGTIFKNAYWNNMTATSLVKITNETRKKNLNEIRAHLIKNNRCISEWCLALKGMSGHSVYMLNKKCKPFLNWFVFAKKKIKSSTHEVLQVILCAHYAFKYRTIPS